ncbi:MAG: hypothetical protein OEY21_09965 [Nitrospira sp.]|nr:hypothetical protein [Nitrospira sp.]MDH5626421.1 hypothetical protein [Nitrospira sp.]
MLKGSAGFLTVQVVVEVEPKEAGDSFILDLALSLFVSLAGCTHKPRIERYST